MTHTIKNKVSDQRQDRLTKLAALALAAFVLAACSAGSSGHGELGKHQQILASCDPGAPPASLLAFDGTGSSASDAIAAERMIAVEDVVRRTAVCSGYLRVLVFSASSTATKVLFDGSLKQEGATDNARLKKVPDAVAQTVNELRTGYSSAIQVLPQGGSDITAQYRLAAEWQQQFGDRYRLDLVMFTDGLQNIGVDLGATVLTKEQATALADQVMVPKLPGASVVVAGLGRVAEGTPPSALVEGLVAYYDRLCQRTEAATCTSVSDYAPQGR